MNNKTIIELCSPENIHTPSIPPYDVSQVVVHNHKPKLDMSDWTDLNVDLFMYLIEGSRFGTWKLSLIFEVGLTQCFDKEATLCFKKEQVS